MTIYSKRYELFNLLNNAKIIGENGIGFPNSNQRFPNSKIGVFPVGKG